MNWLAAEFRDRGDPLKTEIDERQADDEHDRDKQRDDGALEPELNASAFHLPLSIDRPA